MFSNFIWNFKYSRFYNKYKQNDISLFYKNFDYYEELRKLVLTVPVDEINRQIQLNRVIPTYFNNFEDWLHEAAIKLPKILDNNEYLRGETKTLQNMAADDFFLTNESYRVAPVSVIQITEDALTNLYERLRKLPEERRDYIFRHYRELFITGLVVLSFLLECKNSY